ncbi:hypothetical protein TNCT_239191 [Trichonephila clavata]|uniref:Uncharacterized protein n=1 Tax=Trichonephila clavata TaxID=2740835 RepID=A0A8X6F1Q4_TRICU|nr:hypothetical protein TNCT_239191 [Trichonephila clavata]
MCAGIVNDYLKYPYHLPTQLNYRIYQIFLEEVLPESLQEVQVGFRNQMWFQHDGVSIHFSIEASNYLDATFFVLWSSPMSTLVVRFNVP